MKIETERLLLRELTPDDFDHFMKYCQIRKLCSIIQNPLMKSEQRAG